MVYLVVLYSESYEVITKKELLSGLWVEFRTGLEKCGFHDCPKAYGYLEVHGT